MRAKTCPHSLLTRNCRECKNAYMREWRTANPDRVEQVRTYNRLYSRKLRADPVNKVKHREYIKLYMRKRRADPEYWNAILAKQKIEARRRRKERKRWFTAFKKNISCITCGCTKRLHFHHRDIRPGNVCVSALVTQGRSMKQILKEIAKCEPLCFECHHKLHTAERRKARSLVNLH